MGRFYYIPSARPSVAEETAAAAGTSNALVAVYFEPSCTSQSLEGPWHSAGCIINGSNPSPFVFPNGTVVVAFKAIPNGLRIATAPTWRGPYTVLSRDTRLQSCCHAHSGSSTCCGELLLSPQPYGKPYIEDFFLWFDGSAKRWAMLVHQYSFGSGTKVVGPGGFAYTEDESLLSPWHFTGPNHSVYGDAIQLSNGTVLHSDRQRPKLLFGPDGMKPLYLYNGLDASGQKGPTHTFVQQIQSFTPPYDDMHDHAHDGGVRTPTVPEIGNSRDQKLSSTGHQ